MTEVTFVRSSSGEFKGFRATGHSGYAENGSDIVCAGVSALLQSAVLGVINFVGIEAELDIDGGELSLLIPRYPTPQASRDCQVIFNTVLLGLREIEGQFSKYLKVVV